MWYVAVGLCLIVFLLLATRANLGHKRSSRLLEAAGEGTKMADHLSPIFRPRLSLFSDHLRTVLAVKGSLRRAQQRRALDGSGPFRTTLLRRGKGSLRTAPLAGDHFAAILVPFFAATDTRSSREMRDHIRRQAYRNDPES